MTNDEWSSLCFLMDQAWRGDFDDNKRTSYRVFLDKFDAVVVTAALHKLAESGKPFLPEMPEIVKACRAVQSEADGVGAVPGWSEVWRDLQRACAHGSRGYFDADATKQEKAVAWLEEHSHLLVARFFDAEGWRSLALGEWHDDEWGAARQSQLKDRWENFADVAQERLAAGLALQAVGRRGELGPHRMDQTALLEQVIPARPALEAGSSD